MGPSLNFKMNDFIDKSKKISEWLAENLEESDISVTDLGQERIRAGCPCVGLALQSHRAIVLLMERQLIGPAAALVRVMFEAYVRGVWLLYCANDKQIKRYISGKKVNNYFSDLILAVEKLPEFCESVLSHILGASWNTMNSYTHCGWHQIVRGNTEAGIEPCYTKAECIEIIRFADGIALAAGAIIAELLGKKELLLELHSRAAAIKGQLNGESKCKTNP